jgi:hypothetical protein
MFKCCKKKQKEEAPIQQPRINESLLSFKRTNKHLVVDDSETNRLVLRRYLERTGINVTEAIHGQACLDSYNKEELNDFDVIWMDLRMPYKDGIETTTELRKKGYIHYIIGLTGHVEQESQDKCIAAGMNRVIAKPIVKDELYGLLYFLFKVNFEKKS